MGFYVDGKLIQAFNTKTKKFNVKTQQYFYLDVIYLIANFFSGEAEKQLLLKKIGIKRFEKMQKLANKYTPKVAKNMKEKQKKKSKKGKKKNNARGKIPGGLAEIERIVNPKPPPPIIFKKVISTPFGGQPGKK